MKRINQNNFYDLGKHIEQISGFNSNTSTVNVFLTIMHTKTLLTSIMSDEAMQIVVTKRAAENLINVIENFIEAEFRDHTNGAVKIPSSINMDNYNWTFGDPIRQFEHILAAELQTLPTYAVERKGIYYTPYLIDNAVSAFPQSVVAKMPENSKADYCAAGKCLAFDLPSAVGFHVFRAVEAVMNEYYKVFIGALPKVKSRNWGAYITILKRKALEDGVQFPSMKTIELIEHVKDMYRNPLVHPEENLTNDAALALFDIGKSVIIAMVNELNDHEGRQLDLPLPLPLE